MSESKTWFCRTEEDTAEIGRKLASIARRGDCFALYGTLGMGKSVLCRPTEGAREEARLLKRMEVYSAFNLERLVTYLSEKLPDGGEALQKMWSPSAAQPPSGAERSRPEASDGSGHVAGTPRPGPENFRQRLTWQIMHDAPGNPTARSGKYAEQLRLLRSDGKKDRQERRNAKNEGSNSNFVMCSR